MCERRNDFLFKTRICQKLQSFDKFEMEKVIAKGSNACVVDCSHTSNLTNNEKLSFAIKILFNYGHETPNLKDEFQNEYLILENLVYHDNIIQIYSSFYGRPSKQRIELISKELKLDVLDLLLKKDNEGKSIARATLFIVMEKFSLSLEQFVFQNDISVEVGLNICKQIANGLLFLWKNKIVHRDIKLNNIMISIQSDHYIPIIIDFGLAVKVDKTGKCIVRDVGNQIHTAPEILTGGLFGTKDFSKQPSWELGIICYEICSKGECPFDLNDYNKDLPDIDFTLMLKKGYPKEFLLLITDLLQQNSSERISIEEAQIQLNKI
uniref:Protein kinase domain-containing protein n=1 Tax=Arcella intermedia TaxID=1963864 RepID=A0A6B2L8T6_9EUKA